MSNTSIPPFELSNPPAEDLLRVARVVCRVASEANVPFLLVGAAARDLVLGSVWGLSCGRATADIDFGFAISSWPEFNRLRDRLTGTGLLSRAPNQTQRLIYQDTGSAARIPVDFVPFGEQRNQSTRVEYPGRVVMPRSR